MAAFGGNAALGLIGGTIVAVAFNPLAGLALAGVGCVMAARQMTKFISAEYHSQMAYGLRDAALRENNAEPVCQFIRQVLSSDDAYHNFLDKFDKRFTLRVESGEIMKP